MRACEKCFLASTWVANANPSDQSPAVCGFGHGYSHRTWPTSAWTDSFTRLLDLYEIEPDPDLGAEAHVQIQADWRILSHPEPSEALNFLRSSVIGHPLLSEGARVRLRSPGPGADHLASWTQFSEEIRARNRYFPTTVPDSAVLERVFRERAEPIKQDIPLYRARVVEVGALLPAEEMGAPPAAKASAGRANPVGIAYLYLSFSSDTCIYETRVANHTQVAIGTFHATRELSVLNLADIDPPDFFDDDETARISFHRYLTALGSELSKPVRTSDSPTDYIPTQYLSEFAKWLGIDGVLYSSSLHSGGRNLVLFDVSAAVCDGGVTMVEITGLQATWKSL